MQHLRVAAMILPGTTPQVCPVDSIVITNPRREPLQEVTIEFLDPCVWKYVLTHESLAQLRLSVGSDVINTWDVDATTFAGGCYFRVKVTVNGCGYKVALSKSKKTYNCTQSGTCSFIKQTIGFC